MSAKNIILCADGTGNARGRTNITNIGRIFKAIDLRNNPTGTGQSKRIEQIPFYDNGVGTHRIKLLKALGGAFGYGLRGNVIDLYEALCRSYEFNSGDKGSRDRIYLFGFSRGAYTARVLAGLICACGIIDRQGKEIRRGKPLRLKAEEAYDAYRSSRRFWKQDEAEKFRKTWSVDREVPGDDIGKRIDIQFVGVWDTVAAVGLPVNSMAYALNWVFNFVFRDNKPHALIRKGCHALAIDDERHTFHPELWDVSAEKDQQEAAPRIEQVWFAGAHSNVGGGEVKDELSYTSLIWMMKKADRAGLQFRQEIWQDYRKTANPHGKLYDSRAGLKIAYRFKPRDIGELWQQAFGDRPSAGTVPPVKIHESVADRLFGGVTDYGPSNFPPDFMFVDSAGQQTGRWQDQCQEIKKAGNDFKRAFRNAAAIVWYRRGVYISVLATLLTVIAWPFLPWASDLTGATGACQGTSCYFEWVLGLLHGATLGYSGLWARHLLATPWLLNILVGVLGAAGILHLFLKRQMVQSGYEAWHRVLGDVDSLPRENNFYSFAHLIRNSHTGKWINRLFEKLVLPLAAWGLLVFAIYGLWTVCDNAYSSNISSISCPAPNVSDPVTSNPCIDTGIDLKADHAYRLSVMQSSGWFDKTIPAGFPNGFRSDEGGWIMHLASPFRRHQDQPWFRLMGRVGDHGTPFPIQSPEHEYIAEEAGRLYLYVNDVVCTACSDPWIFYKNNKGGLSVTVTVDE